MSAAYKTLEIKLRIEGRTAEPAEVASQLHHQLRDFSETLKRLYKDVNGVPLNIECEVLYDR